MPQEAQPPAGFPEFPAPPEGMPTDIPGLGAGMIAGLGMLMIVFIIVPILLYLFICFCIFRIAKKLDVPAPWLAFIPIIQMLTIVNCAGKPGWWLILMLIPVVNLVIAIIASIAFAEKFGKGAGFGVGLALLSIIFFPILAFTDAQYRSDAAAAPAE